MRSYDPPILQRGLHVAHTASRARSSLRTRRGVYQLILVGYVREPGSLTYPQVTPSVEVTRWGARRDEVPSHPC
jgi:hypothetical protein